jgi:hypothetical protein
MEYDDGLRVNKLIFFWICLMSLVSQQLLELADVVDLRDVSFDLFGTVCFWVRTLSWTESSMENVSTNAILDAPGAGLTFRVSARASHMAWVSSPLHGCPVRIILRFHWWQ